MILYQTLRKERRKGRRRSLTLTQVRMREAKRHVDHINRVLREHDKMVETIAKGETVRLVTPRRQVTALL